MADEFGGAGQDEREVEELARKIREAMDRAGAEAARPWDVDDEGDLARAMELHAAATPIYRQIVDYLDGGGEGGAFRLLPECLGPMGAFFAPGAEDGIALYHAPGTDELVEAALGRIVETAGAGDVDRAFAQAHVVADHASMLQHADPLFKQIDFLGERLRPQALYQLAIRLVAEGTKAGAVKIGLLLMIPLLDENRDNGEVCNVARALVSVFGATDEFAVYAALLARELPEGNGLIWAIARVNSGWGRIHAVNMLQPESDEIALWLLAEGVHNDVLTNYSAGPCYEKTGFEERLAGELDHACFAGAGDILGAFLDGEPCYDMASLPDPLGTVAAYVGHAERRDDLDEHDRGVMLRLAESLAEEDAAPGLEARLRALAAG